MEKVEEQHPRVTVFVAHGSEEIETVSVIDILRRAEFQVTVVKVPNSAEDTELMCKMSRGVFMVEFFH